MLVQHQLTPVVLTARPELTMYRNEVWLFANVNHWPASEHVGRIQDTADNDAFSGTGMPRCYGAVYINATHIGYSES